MLDDTEYTFNVHGTSQSIVSHSPDVARERVLLRICDDDPENSYCDEDIWKAQRTALGAFAWTALEGQKPTTRQLPLIEALKLRDMRRGQQAI